MTTVTDKLFYAPAEGFSSQVSIASNTSPDWSQDLGLVFQSDIFMCSVDNKGRGIWAEDTDFKNCCTSSHRTNLVPD